MKSTETNEDRAQFVLMIQEIEAAKTAPILQKTEFAQKAISRAAGLVGRLLDRVEALEARANG